MGQATESCSPPGHLHDCPGPSTGGDGVDFHVQNRLWGRGVGVLSPWLTYAVSLRPWVRPHQLHSRPRGMQAGPSAMSIFWDRGWNVSDAWL